MREWINELKIAIIEEDGEKLINLAENIPTTDDVDLAIEASTLMQEAIKFAQEKKINISNELAKLKKAKGYLN